MSGSIDLTRFSIPASVPDSELGTAAARALIMHGEHVTGQTHHVEIAAVALQIAAGSARPAIR